VLTRLAAGAWVLRQFCDEQGDSLAQHVMTNTRRYQMMFADAADELMPVPTTR
jgi:hypothetical protein